MEHPAATQREGEGSEATAGEGEHPAPPQREREGPGATVGEGEGPEGTVGEGNDRVGISGLSSLY